MKKSFCNTLCITMVIIIPYIFLSEYANEIRELKSEVKTTRFQLEESQRDIRLLKQDVEIINNILITKDFEGRK